MAPPVVQPAESTNRSARDKSHAHFVCDHEAMRRTTVSLDEPLLRDLHRVAAERKLSIAAFVREAVAENLARHRPRPRSLGMGASGHSDTARCSGDERPEPRAWR